MSLCVAAHRRNVLPDRKKSRTVGTAARSYRLPNCYPLRLELLEERLLLHWGQTFRQRRNV